MSRPKHDADAFPDTIRFLNLLDPSAETFHFTTIKESEGKGLVREFPGTFQQQSAFPYGLKSSRLRSVRGRQRNGWQRTQS